MSRLDCRAVADLLAEHLDRLFLEFVPDARPERNELRGHGPDGAVWAIVTKGAKRGVFANWGDPAQAGDALELIHYARFPGEQGRRESYRWALGWLGLAENLPDDARDARLADAQAQRAAAAARRAHLEAEDRQARHKRAKGIYLEGSRGFQDAPELADYLTTRGIPADDLPEAPRNLRFRNLLWYDAVQSYPAMVAAIVHPITRAHQATHCTFLEHREGHWRNIPVRPRRLTFGNKLGGVIPLLRGASGKRIPPEGDTLLIAEGIENALAAALCCPETHGVPEYPRVWAAIDIGNFAAIELPDEIYSVILVHDQDNERFGEYRDRIAHAWLHEGRSVQHLRVPEGFKDFNQYVERLVKARDALVAYAD